MPVLHPFPTEARGWAAVQRYMTARRAPATRKAYEACLRQVEAWCRSVGNPAFPLSPEALARFLAEKADAGFALTTLRRYVAAVGEAHRVGAVPDPSMTPLIEELMAGIARLGRKPSSRKAALTVTELRAMIDSLPQTLLGLRDRAILAFGFATALRRSELAALEAGDLGFSSDGCEVLIRRSKSDQTGEGQRVFLPRGGEPCPVAALEHWLASSAISEGALFRRVSRADRLLALPLEGQAIAGVVHRAARGAGLAPGRFAAHSLRAGFATAAAASGASAWAIMTVTRHRSPHALRTYVRPDRVRELSAPLRVL